jgi:hypothetical protein
VTKIDYLKFLRASEGTLSRWSWLHLQLFAPTPVQGGLTSGRQIVKIIAESLSQHNEKHVPTPLSEIRVGRRKRYIIYIQQNVKNSQKQVMKTFQIENITKMKS